MATQNFITSVKKINTQPIRKGPGLFNFMKRLFGLETLIPAHSTGKSRKCSGGSGFNSQVQNVAFLNLAGETRILAY